MIEYQWSNYTGLSSDELYEILRARQDVFIIEQNSTYFDIDGLDANAWHFIAWENPIVNEHDNKAKKILAAYLRVLPPTPDNSCVTITRVLSTKTYRGKGLSKHLLETTLVRAAEQYPKSDIKLSAQVYLEDFYSRYGFKTTSSPYDLDGILHIDMIKRVAASNCIKQKL